MKKRFIAILFLCSYLFTVIGHIFISHHNHSSSFQISAIEDFIHDHSHCHDLLGNEKENLHDHSLHHCCCSFESEKYIDAKEQNYLKKGSFHFSSKFVLALNLENTIFQLRKKSACPTDRKEVLNLFFLHKSYSLRAPPVI